jgi:hypothetical protein
LLARPDNAPGLGGGPEVVEVLEVHWVPDRPAC